MKRTYSLVIVLFVAFFVFFAKVQANENISAYLDKSEIFIGDIIELTVKAELELSAQINVNQSFNFDGFDILDFKIDHLIDKENTYILKFKLLSLKTGNIAISSLTVFFINPDGTNNLFFTPKQNVLVKSVVESTGSQDINDIKALRKIRLKAVYILFYFILIILIVTLNYFLVINLLRNRKNVTIDPRIKALDDLSFLYKNRSNVNIRELYYKMSEILRTYISKKYNFYALEMTTAELLENAESFLPSDINIVEFKKYLTVFVLAKYAAFTPCKAEMKRDYDFTKKLLEIL